MKKLSKSEFMKKIINDKYEKRRLENEGENAAKSHFVNNVARTNKAIRR